MSHATPTARCEIKRERAERHTHLLDFPIFCDMIASSSGRWSNQ